MDREIGDMNEDNLSGTPLLSNLRYNFAITKENFNALGMGREFDDHDAMSMLIWLKQKIKNYFMRSEKKPHQLLRRSISGVFEI